MTATPRTISFIESLLDERELQLQPGQTIEQLKEQAATLSQEQASRWIDRLKSLPRVRATRTEVAEPDAGMYVAKNGDVIRVYLGQQSGKMLAKKLVDTGRPHPEDPSITLHEWEYLGKATRFVGGARRMTLEEAKEFGRMSGTCCNCGKRLDVPESVEAGIGPVCAKRFS